MYQCTCTMYIIHMYMYMYYSNGQEVLVWIGVRHNNYVPQYNNTSTIPALVIHVNWIHRYIYTAQLLYVFVYTPLWFGMHSLYVHVPPTIH